MASADVTELFLSICFAEFELNRPCKPSLLMILQLQAQSKTRVPAKH